MSKKRNTNRYLTRRRTQQRRNRKKGDRNQRNLKIQLHVSQDDWGNIQPSEIAVLLQDTAFHINRLLRVPFDEKIQVVPSQAAHPEVHIAHPQRNHISSESLLEMIFGVSLHTSLPTEFCHVLSNYQKIKEKSK